MAEKTPTHIGGYQIRKKLGEGAFGRVYQAYDANVNRLVAIKVLLLTDKEVVTRFKNEAIVAGNLRHKNIVTIYEFGEHEGLPFLAMEYLDGQNLQEVIRSKKPLSMLQRISIMTQIADGLDCAHRHGVVHRDVKPANMMLLADGTVKIMDFGIARLTGSQQATRLTQQGNVLGTLLYMAPEQFTADSEVDALCDIFACGEVFYELLSGRHPFEASEARILVYKVTVEDPQPVRNLVPDCPPALDDVLSRMMSKARDLRYHSLKEVLFDIQPVLIDLQQERAATLMGQAQELFQRNEADAANALLPEILELDPGNRTAYRLRDQIQRSLLKPKIEALLKSGRDELAKRRFHEAIQAFTAAARLDAANTEIQDLLAQARAAQEQSQRASQLVAEARQAFDHQNLTGAYKSASEALLLDPENQQAARLLLVIQSAIDRKRQQQQMEEALLKAEHLLMVQAYDRALEVLAGLNPSEPRVEQLAGRIRAQKLEHERGVRLQAGMAAATEMLREQKLEEAVKHLGDLSGEFPDKPDVLHLLEYARKELQAQQRAQAVEQIKAEALSRADANDFRGALEILDKGLPQYDDSSLVRLLGDIMSRKAAWEREEALRAARARSERLRAEGKLPDAIQAVESAIRNYSADPGMMEFLRSLEGEWEQAKRAEEIRAAVTQARRLLEAGQAEKALRTLPDAARRFPDSTEIQAVLAEAQEAFQVQARQRELEALTAEARAHADRNNHDAALQVLDRGLEKYPQEAGLAALRQDVVQKRAALLRRQDVQRTVQESNRLAAEGRFPEAFELIGDALRRYEGELALVDVQRKLQIDWERRRRAQAIVETGNQARTLLEQGKSAEAVELLRTACERYPEARDLQSMLARAQRAAAIEQFGNEVRAQIDERQFEQALQRLDQGLRTWPGERNLTALQAEAAAGLAAERCRQLAAQGRPAEALRLVDAALGEYPGEAGLLAARREAQARLEEAERLRRRAADLESLSRIENDSRTLVDAAQIRDVADRVRNLAKPYQGDAEFEAASARILNLLAEMEQANALLAGRDFAALQTACARLRTDWPAHIFFQRLEAEAARGVRQLALQELRRRVQAEPDLRAKGQLLDDALQRYAEEAWLQQEARVVRSRLALADSVVEKAKAASQAGRWDEAIEQWNALRALYGNYPGLERELQSLAERKEQALAQTRAGYLDQIRGQMASCQYEPAVEALARALREFAGDAELQALRDQVDFALRSVLEARAAAARQAFPQAAGILESALGRYAGDALLENEAGRLAQQAAARETAIAEAVRQADELAAQQQRLDDAWQVAESASAQYGEDPRLLDLRRRLQALRKQAEHVQHAVRRARALTVERKFAQAGKVIEAELARYAGDPVLERELQTIREVAVRQIRDLAGQQQLDDARQLAEATLAQFPDDPALAEAARQANLQALRRLEQEARALTADSQIPNLAQKLRAIAEPYADDAGIAPACAALGQQLEAMQQAGAMLARREYAGALEICARYPDQSLLQNLKAEAERGERALRVAGIERQLEAEPDLRRQAELLAAAIRSMPDESSFAERSRAVQATLDQVDLTAQRARQAETEDRWDEALALWNAVRGLYKNYPGLDEGIARVQEHKRQALSAERARLDAQIREKMDAGDYETLRTLLPQAQQQFPGDAGLEKLAGQVQSARQAVRQARKLAVEGKLPQAAEVFEAALKTYPGDKLLERELEGVRQEMARQVQDRADAIHQAAQQIESFTAQNKLDDALRLARSAVQRYPGEAILLTAQEQARRKHQRNAALESLRDLDAEAGALSSASGIAGLQTKARNLAAPYAGDEEIGRAEADLQRQLAAMAEAQTLVDQQNFDAALAVCAGHPGHRYFARVKTDAERGQRAARVVEVQRQVDEECDLMRQLELLDATIRFLPDPTLMERSRVVRGKLDQVNVLVHKARQAEQAERWDEALAQWEAVGQLYKDYGGLADEIERVKALKERAHAARRERLGDEIWQRVNAGDHDAAAALLQQAEQEYPGDGELQFLREQVESVRQCMREARDLAAKGRFEDAVRALEAALARNAGDASLQRELDDVRRQAERHAILTTADGLRAQGKFDEALQTLEPLGSTDPAVDQFRDAIRRDREAAQRGEEVREALFRVRKLAREGDHQAIVQAVHGFPAHVQQDPEIREVLAAADEILEEQRQRQAVDELTAQTRALAQQSRFGEALQLLDRGARQYSVGGPQISAARAEVVAAQTAWQQARAAEQAAAHAAQLEAAREVQRRRALEQLTAEVDRLCARKKFAAALRKIDESDAAGAESAALRARVAALQTEVVSGPEPKPKSRIVWIAGAAALLALAAWGISVLLHRDATLIVETSPGAIMSVDKSAGTLADDKGIVSVHVPAGRHIVDVSKPGFENAEQEVEVKSGATSRLTVPLNPGRRPLTATPVITSLDPGSVVNLGAAFRLGVNGSGFQRSATVKWNGAALRTTYTKATQLRAEVPANLVSSPGKAVITVVNPPDVASAPVTLPINPSAPAIAGLQPDSANAGEEFILRVTGSGFQPGAAVGWGAKRLQATVESATSLRAAVTKLLTAKPGAVAVTVVNPGDVASSPMTFTVKSLTPTPAISGLNPQQATAGGADFTLTVTGDNFLQGASVRWNGSQLTARINGPTQLQVQVAPGLIATPGNARITVVNPGGVTSPEYNLRIVAAPAISGLNPNSAAAGGAINLTVNGSGFQAGAVLEFNKSQLPANVAGQTQLRVAVPANLVAPPGTVSVVVINPGNIRSTAATFTVNPAPVVVPPPVISGLNPASAVAGGDKFELTVNGSGFAQGASIRWNGSTLTPVSGNATQLRATVPAEFIAHQIPVNITVVNPDRQSSNALAFTINPPAVAQPVIAGLNPNSTPAGGSGLSLVVNGSGFQPGATVRWEGSSLVTTFIGPGQLRAAVLPGRIAAPGAAAITVVNPGTLPSAPMTFTILPPQGARSDPDVAGVKSVLTEYARAYSAKDFDRVEALYPSMPATDKNTLKRFFKDDNYTVSYTIEFDQPIIKGDDATVNARAVVTQSYRRQKPQTVTRNVVVTLHKGGGQWTIAAFR